MYELGAGGRQVYLPGPRTWWVDAWSGRRLRGGKSAAVHAPLERIPMFARPGAVVETLAPSAGTALEQTGHQFPGLGTPGLRRVLHVYPGVQATTTRGWDMLVNKTHAAGAARGGMGRGKRLVRLEVRTHCNSTV